MPADDPESVPHGRFKRSGSAHRTIGSARPRSGSRCWAFLRSSPRSEPVASGERDNGHDRNAASGVRASAAGGPGPLAKAGAPDGRGRAAGLHGRDPPGSVSDRLPVDPHHRLAVPAPGDCGVRARRPGRRVGQPGWRVPRAQRLRFPLWAATSCRYGSACSGSPRSARPPESWLGWSRWRPSRRWRCARWSQIRAPGLDSRGMVRLAGWPPACRQPGLRRRQSPGFAFWPSYYWAPQLLAQAAREPRQPSAA